MILATAITFFIVGVIVGQTSFWLVNEKPIRREKEK